jgi:plasmid stabilization system protein ParE
MANPVIVHPRAKRDLRQVLHRIESQRTFRAGFRWYSGAITAIDTLDDQPERCPLADEADELGIELRMLLYGRKPNVYRILFILLGSVVQFLRVRHAAQDRISCDDLH